MKSTVKNIIKFLSPKWLINMEVQLASYCQQVGCRIDMILFPKKAVWSCTCCGVRFRSWTKANYGKYPKTFNPARYEHTKQEVLCPYCKALPRHRILAYWCQKHLDEFKNAKILYFASEYSMELWMKRNKIRYESADLYKKADLRLDIQKTGLQDNAYDIIICNHVLEHVDDFREALREMYRVLRPGGLFICSFPMDPKVELLDEDREVQTDEERVLRFGQNDHKRVFGMQSDTFLTEAGFEVEFIRGEDCPDEILPIVGPADYDMNRLFACRK